MFKRSILVLLATVLSTPAVTQAQGGQEAAVREVVEGFKSALRGGDGAAALAHLDPTVRIFEGGHAETKEEYASGHLGGDMAFLAAVRTTTTWSQVDLHGEVAVYLSEYRTQGTYREREIDAHGTETLVLARGPQGWKIRHIHWSSR